MGSGIVGLWTAEVLATAGHQVTVLSRSGVAGSTSAAAASVLVPFLPGDPNAPSFQRSLRWANETILYLQALGQGRHLERVVCYEFGVEEVIEYGFAVHKLEYLDFSPFSIVALDRLIAGCNMAVRFECYLCNSMVFLKMLQSDLMRRGVTFKAGNISSIAEIGHVDANVIFNCLGYQTIFPDLELYPVFGQSIYIPVHKTSEPYFGLCAGDHSVFKHKRGLHVGAHFLIGDAGPVPRRDLFERSIAFVRGPFRELCGSVDLEVPVINFEQVERVNAGIRPFRPSGPRVQLDYVRGKMVVHNYGHGAHGWTIGYGSALEAARLAGLI